MIKKTRHKYLESTFLIKVFQTIILNFHLDSPLQPTTRTERYVTCICIGIHPIYSQDAHSKFQIAIDITVRLFSLRK